MSAHSNELPSTQTKLLLRLTQEGAAREIAWREFHNAYAPVIAGFARRMGARQSEIDDVVQEVILGFYTAIPEFRYDRSQGRFRGYLKTCAWRKLEKYITKRMFSLDVAQAALLAVNSDIDDAWDKAWEQAQLVQAMKIVRERYSRRADQRKTFEAFEHYVLLERPAIEVAAALAMSIDQVHQAKSRIQRALRDTMEAMDAFAD